MQCRKILNSGYGCSEDSCSVNGTVSWFSHPRNNLAMLQESMYVNYPKIPFLGLLCCEI